MRVELLHSKGSALASTLKERTERVLIDVAPYEHIATVAAAKTKTKTTTKATGGSRHPTTPILRVNGFPVIPSTGAESSAIPSEAEIRVAVTQAALTAGPASIRLPLRHRRCIMAGVLLILVGGVLGQLLVWGSAITLLGIALLPVGFASNGRRLGPQPLMVTAGVCVLVWVGLTLWYWAPLLLGSTEPVISPPQTIFWLGAVFFGAAWLVVLRAVLVRRTLRRDLRNYLATALQGPVPSAQ